MQPSAAFGVAESGGEAAVSQYWKTQDLQETQRIIRFDEIHFLDGF